MPIYYRDAAPVAGHYAEGKVFWQGQQLLDEGDGTGDQAHDVATTTAGNWERRLESKSFTRRPGQETF